MVFSFFILIIVFLFHFRTSISLPEDGMRKILPNLKPFPKPPKNILAQGFETVQRQSLNLNIPASTLQSPASQMLKQNIPTPTSQTLPSQTADFIPTQNLPTFQNQTLTQSSSTPTSQLIQNQTSTPERSSPNDVAAEMATDHAPCTILQGSEKENIQPTSEETLGGNVGERNPEGLRTDASEDAKVIIISLLRHDCHPCARK